MSNKVYLVKFDAYHSNYIPYSLIYLSNILQKNGLDCQILHNIYIKDIEKDKREFARKILEDKPFLVGFSVITGRGIKYSVELSKLIKQNNPNIKIVWGGTHPTLLPKETLKNDYIDYVICEEGEARIMNLINFINGSKDINFDGICYKENGDIIINPPQEKVHDISKWTQIDWEKFDLTPYINFDLGAPKLSYITSRGCPYNCGFCYNQTIGNNKRYDKKEVNHVVSDIEYFKKKYKIKHIHFNDDNFFFDKDRAFNIIDKVKLPYFAESRINYFNEDFAKRLADTQCKLLMCGAESGVERILIYIRKGLVRDKIIEAAKLLGKYNIRASWSFILGFPTETAEEVKETFEFMKLINFLAKRRICKPGVYVPYPGSFLYEESIKYGACLPDSLEDWWKLERYNTSQILPWFNRENYEILLSEYIEGTNKILPRIFRKLKLIYGKTKWRISYEAGKD